MQSSTQYLWNTSTNVQNCVLIPVHADNASCSSHNRRQPISLLSTARSNVVMHNGVLFCPPSFLHHPINPCLLNGAAEPHSTKATMTSTPQVTMATTMTKTLTPPTMLQLHSPVDRASHTCPTTPLISIGTCCWWQWCFQWQRQCHRQWWWHRWCRQQCWQQQPHQRPHRIRQPIQAAPLWPTTVTTHQFTWHLNGRRLLRQQWPSLLFTCWWQWRMLWLLPWRALLFLLWRQHCCSCCCHIFFVPASFLLLLCHSCCCRVIVFVAAALFLVPAVSAWLFCRVVVCCCCSIVSLCHGIHAAVFGCHIGFGCCSVVSLFFVVTSLVLFVTSLFFVAASLLLDSAASHHCFLLWRHW